MFQITSVRLHQKLVTDLTLSDKQRSDGYSLAKQINKKCNRKTPYNKSERIFGSYEWGPVQTCIIWKIGSTLIRRLYMMKTSLEFRNITNPYDIYFGKVYPLKPTLSNDGLKIRFMFARDPYKRLVSGYVDKLLAPNPVYWRLIGIPAIIKTRLTPSTNSLRCGHDLTFSEYVRYVIMAMDPKQKAVIPDGHFDRMTSLCRPCSVKYDFVGKMESFAGDSLELVRHLKLSNETVDLLETEGSHFAWLDAIKDTAHQPFDQNFRKGYAKCISFHEALKRSWTKLQIRGLIGSHDFPLTQAGPTNNLTEEQFVQLAVEAREKSTLQERQSLKLKNFLELFSGVSNEELETIRTIYADDFNLFGYNDRPNTLFGSDPK